MKEVLDTVSSATQCDIQSATPRKRPQANPVEQHRNALSAHFDPLRVPTTILRERLASLNNSLILMS